MEKLRIESLSFTYPERERKALCDVNLSVKEGEFVLLCGQSGCGKTTLLRMLKPSLSPYGTLCGKIYFDGKEISVLSARDEASGIGFVMQNPENSTVTDKVWHELAFGPESLGLPADEIRARVSEMTSFFGIQEFFQKNVDELSGGVKQLVSLASVMVMQPSLLVLDEPTSQLDPINAREFLSALKRINAELGTTVILSEHRLEEALPLADRAVVLDGGRIIADGTPGEICKMLKEENHSMHKALPTPVRVWSRVENTLPCPVTVKEGKEWLERFCETGRIDPSLIPKDSETQAEGTAVEIKDACFRYKKDAPDVLRGLCMRVKKGELYCLLGGNGVGKTTVLSVISGQNKVYRGKVLINGTSIDSIRYLYRGLLTSLPQNPQCLFSKSSVYDELLEMTDGNREEEIKMVARLCGIENLLSFHPYDLSGGEMQRAALAKVLLTEPQMLLLDEPTKGMDAQFKEEFADILASLKVKGVTIIMVSHDIEFCAEYADRCALFFDGNIASVGTPREFFKQKTFYTTAANRMARRILPDAVLPSDIILACGGAPFDKGKARYDDGRERCDTPQEETKEPVKEKIEKKPISKKMLTVWLLILLAVPLTILLGRNFFGDRKYFATSLLVILEMTLPFLALFEARKPRARELVIISVLCAIAVAGRAAFFMVPQFKPVIAIVIISGVCFGGESGFLVGALCAFVSNFFFGQGPWTPWQMFALGVIGFLAGALFYNRRAGKSKIALCIFGALSTFLVYGGIMNSYYILLSQQNPTLSMLIASYLTALPFDIMHSASSAFFLFVFSGAVREKLERVKIKYGILS